MRMRLYGVVEAKVDAINPTIKDAPVLRLRLGDDIFDTLYGPTLAISDDFFYRLEIGHTVLVATDVKAFLRSPW